jgi:hypothetical protein
MTKKIEIKSEKFKNIPVEEDTEINLRIEVKLGKYDVVYESWYWKMEASGGESIIFYHEDIKELSKKEIIALVRTSEVINKDSGTTITLNSEGYTFVNFNFWVD